MKKAKKKVKKVIKKRVKRTRFGNVFLVLGLVWLAVGYAIYSRPGIWSLGIAFLIIGFILKLMKR